MRAWITFSILLSISSAHAGPLPLTPAPAGAKLYFISPDAGSKIASQVTVRFGLSGIGVAPAGVVKENTGHHHLLIDVTALPPMDQPLPNDEKHRHFGGGQTEVTLELAPGSHTLQLSLVDANHIPHNPPILSEKISVEVH